MKSSIPCVVVGGGYAGLAASHQLSLAGVEHLVLERDRVGETWRSQRWDSFALNTNRRHSAFPGETAGGAPVPADGFALRDELVREFERYVAERRLPVETGAEVTAAEPGARAGSFHLHLRRAGRAETLAAENVVVAAGFQNVPVIPPAAASIPPRVPQLHTADYRNPDALPNGAVLVVGSAQSGCQVAEDLLERGRHVYLSASKVARVPRRYRGRDIVDWMIDSGFWDVRVQDLEDPKMQFAAQPQVSGVGPLGRTVSLQHLARSGATLLGRLTGAAGDTLHFDDGLAACVQFGDERSAFFKRLVDGFIERAGLKAPAPAPDPADAPDDGTAAANAPATLDVRRDDISTIIWCTGFTGAFGWLHLPAFDARGRPAHQRGISPVPGLYFLGAPWLHKRKSGVIYGMNEDAEHVVQHVVKRRQR